MAVTGVARCEPSKRRRWRVSCRLSLAAAIILVGTSAQGQGDAGASSAEQNRQAMLHQLGITALIPGPSGDEQAANAANYDEARANPFPDLPDPLRTKSGTPVTSAKSWFDVRRPEIVEDYEREIYGQVPARAPRITWRVVTTDHEMVGFTPVIARRVIGHADNAASPAIAVDIRMTIVTPAQGPGRVPLLIMFGRDDFPAPAQPARADAERIDAVMKAALVSQDASLAAVFAAHPAFTLYAPTPFHLPQRDAHGDYPRPEQMIAAGWGYAMLDTDTIQADSAAGLTAGVIGLSTRGGPRKPEDWGVLRAWGWGASRALDFLASDPSVDPARIGVEGVSRYGKAALIAMAFDRRFAVGLIGSSGKGGATLLRRNFGEAVASLAEGASYWMAGNFMKYDAKTASHVLNAGDLPVDSHELLALCAPRPVFISYGVPQEGDARWLDHRGSFMAAVAAGQVYRLLGARDLGVGDDYRHAVMPAVNTGLLDGDLAWRQHDSGHTDTPNLTVFAAWADRHLTGGR